MNAGVYVAGWVVLALGLALAVGRAMAWARANEREVIRRTRVCGTCQHWSRVTEFRQDQVIGRNFGECQSPLVGKGYDVDWLPEGGAIVENDEGWGIVTHAEFGCVGWEPKA
jgi:hypothetical protein